MSAQRSRFSIDATQADGKGSPSGIGNPPLHEAVASTADAEDYIGDVSQGCGFMPLRDVAKSM